MPRLHRVLYESTATGSTDSLLNVATILGQSQRNNSQTNLTGALVAHRGRFIQVIEGPAEAIDALLDRLRVDPRHKDLRVIDRALVEQRSFDSWSMASARVTPEVEPLLDRIVDRLDTSVAETVEALRAATA
ncbi:BLUF domain-containing protein [Brevundimonas aurifodinae]|uniref:BLUF domain-containing protein n=2 Tax=Brevundimonas TaxID=41275 RepID=A0ABV1NJF4_9CAUL|nr:MAG: blue light sensor protein [Brevundimonas sp. 12-68-7]OYX34738.1 MAG: blue light sensor protein [Brevundimonas subvibrioides]